MAIVNNLIKQLFYLDEQIGLIYEAIQYRMKHHKEEWLFIITTDHGRDSRTGKSHGRQSLRERTTWIVTNSKTTNSYFHDFEPGIVDILPTMTRFINLKIPIESERELDGVPLIGKVSLVKPEIKLDKNNLTMKWKALDNTGNVMVWLSTKNLFRDGSMDNYTLIGTVPIASQFAAFDIKDYSSELYKIVLEGPYNMVNRWVVKL